MGPVVINDEQEPIQPPLQKKTYLKTQREKIDNFSQFTYVINCKKDKEA
jgi:hypothetical protein